MDTIKKVPDVGVKHRGTTDNKLGGVLISEYISISCVKTISEILNARGFDSCLQKDFYIIKNLE